MAVDTTPIQAIYDRLSQVSAFHPGTTEIFDDFLQEAGDVISLVSGSETFDFPIFAQHMKWTGSMLTSMESTGNETRNELPPLQRRAKNRGYGAGQRITEQGVIYDTEFIKTNRVIGMEARAMGVLLDANGNPMVDPNDPNEFLYDTTSSTGAKIYSNLSLAANRASLVSAINDVSGTQISGSKIDLSAQGTVLVEAINVRNPSSTLIKLSAAQIDLDGYVTASYIDAEKLVVDQLISTSGYAQTITVKNLNAGTGNVTGSTVYATDSLSIGSSTPSAAGTLYFNGTQLYKNTLGMGTLSGGGYSIVNETILTAKNNTTVNLNHYHDIDIEEVTSGAHQGQMQVTIGAAVATSDTTDHISFFKIADTQAYQAGVSAATYAGKNSVTISSTLSWTTTPAAAISVAQNAVTVSTSGRTDSSGTASESTKTINLYSQGSTSGLTATFYVTQSDSTDANRIIKRTATCSDSNLTAGNIKNGVSIFGVTGTYQGSTGGISTMTISSGMSTEPSADYSGGTLSANSWYTVTATPNSGNAKVMKFKTPANSGTTDASLIDLQVQTPTTTTMNNYSGTYTNRVAMTTLTRYITDYSGMNTRYYVPIKAKFNSGSSTKLYYVTLPTKGELA